MLKNIELVVAGKVDGGIATNADTDETWRGWSWAWEGKVGLDRVPDLWAV